MSQSKEEEDLAYLFLQLGEKEQKVVIFLYEWDRPIRVGDIRRYVDFPHSTLNSVIKRLKAKNVVNWEEYGLVNLDTIGKKIAAHHLQHHMTIHHFFQESLGLSAEEAHVEGLKSAGILSCKTVRLMKANIPDRELNQCGIIYEPPQK